MFGNTFPGRLGLIPTLLTLGILIHSAVSAAPEGWTNYTTSADRSSEPWYRLPEGYVLHPDPTNEYRLQFHNTLGPVMSAWSLYGPISHVLYACEVLDKYPDEYTYHERDVQIRLKRSAFEPPPINPDAGQEAAYLLHQTIGRFRVPNTDFDVWKGNIMVLQGSIYHDWDQVNNAGSFSTGNVS